MPVNKSVPLRAFTLVEVLALLAIITLLTTMLLPALAKGRVKDKSIVCQRNTKELAIAWQLYASNFNDQFCNNFVIPDTLDTIQSRRLQNWANNVMTWAISGVDGNSVTNLDLAKSGALSKYASDPLYIYKCPADNFLSSAQTRAGWTTRLRSKSMNILFGRNDSLSSSATGRSWVDAGAYRQFLKLSDLPNPDQTWVTIDEHADSINDGVFINSSNPNAATWGDIPASYHNGAVSIAFADGHIELHRWHGATSTIRVSYSYPNLKTFNALDKEDYRWLFSRIGFIPYK